MDKENDNEFFVRYHATIFDAIAKYCASDENYDNIMKCFMDFFFEKNLSIGSLKNDTLMKNKKINITKLIEYKLDDNNKLKCNIDVINYAIIHNRVDIIEQLIKSDIQLKYDFFAINRAIKNHSWNTLKWLCDNDCDIPYHANIIGNLMLHADLETLKTWVTLFEKKQYSLHYRPYIISQVSEKGRTDILDFCRKNIKLFYDEDAVCYAIRANQYKTVNWWLESGLKLNISKNTLKFAK